MTDPLNVVTEVVSSLYIVLGQNFNSRDDIKYAVRFFSVEKKTVFEMLSVLSSII